MSGSMYAKCRRNIQDLDEFLQERLTLCLALKSVEYAVLDELQMMGLEQAGVAVKVEILTVTGIWYVFLYHQKPVSVVVKACHGGWAGWFCKTGFI